MNTRSSSRNRPWLWVVQIGGLLLLVGAVIGLAMATLPSVSSPTAIKTTGTLSPQTPATFIGAQSVILDTPTLYPTDYSPAKQTLEVSEQETQIAAALTPLPSGTVWSFSAPTTTPFPSQFDQPPSTPAGAGIIIDSLPTASIGKLIGVRIANLWSEETGDRKIIVYAGSDWNDDAQGIIFVAQVTLSGDILPDGGYYITPDKTGALRIISAEGERLTLLSQNGDTYYFDVPGQTFVSSPSQSVPIATFAPTFTPEPSSTSNFGDDAPNNPHDVTADSPHNTDLHYTINPSDDIDWFRFRNSIPGMIRIDLTNLAANYDVYVYGASDSRLYASSTNGGVISEEGILPDSPIGEYYVEVVGANSAAVSITPYTLRVEMDRTPPTLSLSVNPVELSPPNHQLVSVQPFAQAADDLDPNPIITLVSVVSNEPDSGTGDDDVPGDIVINPDGTLQLRAELSDAGTGRAYTITYSAKDRAGNESIQSVTVSVRYAFTGFFQPADNLPTLNVVNAGRAIPVKFSLGGDYGLNIFAVGYPSSSAVTCGTTAEDAIEETVTAGNSSLSYDASTEQYTYVWKTETSWAGTCRTLVVKLNDGTYHYANFKFK